MVFVKMLTSAFDMESTAVSLDLLTGEDLDALRQASGLGSKSPLTNPASLNRSKRYLILTYQGEFDKVHYPMALSYYEQEDVNELKRAIVRLRDELESVKKSQIDTKSLREVEVLVMSYKADRDKLSRELEEMRSDRSRLQATIDALQNENHLLRTKAEVLESQLITRSVPQPPDRFGRRPISGASSSSVRNVARSRASSIASSPTHSRLNSPIRQRTRNQQPSSPYRQPLSRKPPLVRKDISPRMPVREVSPRHMRMPQPAVTNPAPVALSEVDARLQALQNFLRHQKAASRDF